MMMMMMGAVCLARNTVLPGRRLSNTQYCYTRRVWVSGRLQKSTRTSDQRPLSGGFRSRDDDVTVAGW